MPLYICIYANKCEYIYIYIYICPKPQTLNPFSIC